MKRNRKFIAIMCVLLILAGFPMAAFAADQKDGAHGVVVGATPIDQGMANNAKDITIYNDKIAVSFAVGTPNYWNMTKGSILDVALVKGQDSQGKPIFGVDLVNDVEFLNNYWTASDAFEGKDLLNDDVEVSYEELADSVVVTAKTRYYKEGHDKPLNVTIKYTLEDGKNYVTMVTTMENPDGNQPYEAMNAGYSISTLAANMTAPFGYYPDVKATGIRVANDSRINDPMANFVTTYGQASLGSTYCVSVQLDGADTYKGSSGYKDIYKRVDVAGGETVTFTGEMLVSDNASTTPVVERNIEKLGLKAAEITGKVADDKGKPVKDAFVAIYKAGAYVTADTDKVVNVERAPFAWVMTDTDGKYSFKLADGEYSVHAEALGKTPSDVQKLAVTGGAADKAVLDFVLQPGAHATLKVHDGNGKNIPARIDVKSSASTDIKLLGSSVYFANKVGNEYVADFDVPAGTFEFSASYGADFESKSSSIKDIEIKAGETYANDKDLVIKELINPREKNWYNMDNHQHSSIGDGATPVDQLFIAQVAAKLDLNIVSDHDSVQSVAQMVKMAKDAGRPVIPSLEVSPGWGHIGILNTSYQDAGDTTPISPALKPGEIMAKGKDMGAVVVVNHPYSDYGFFKNRAGVIGGNEAAAENFDLIEIQSTVDLSDEDNMDAKALSAAMNNYWNKGEKKFLSAGSDQHDVKSGLYPGIIRMYTYIQGDVTGESYLASLKAGHSYATMGPLFIPGENTMFGETYDVKNGESLVFNADVQAVNTLKKIEVYSMGKVVASFDYDTAEAVKFSYEMKNDGTKNLWYSFVATDGNGKYAMTNPIWVDDFKNSGSAVTRGQFVEMLFSLNKAEYKAGGESFSDIPKDASYATAVAWAKENGIVKGTSATTFTPNASITREQMATILYNFAKNKGIDVDKADGAKAAAFSDWGKVSEYAKAPVKWCVDIELIVGTTDKTIEPKATATREQATIVIQRTIDMK